MSKRPELRHYDIAPRVTAFSTTRHGGVGEGSYSEFNINAYCGDRPEAVAANLEALASELGTASCNIVMPHQTHGVETRVVANDFFALPSNVRQMVLDGVDAVLTDVPNVCIGVSTADCIPILLYDPAHHAAAAVHAGWRGTAKCMAHHAIVAMQLAYGSRPEDLKAVVGPGISVDNFEVGDEVYNEFAAANFDMDTIARREEKWHLDLPLCNRQQLEASGLMPENITMCGVCTYDNVADYFSARRLGKESGRIFTGIMLGE